MKLSNLTSVGSSEEGAFFGYFNEKQFDGTSALFHYTPYIDKLPENFEDTVKISSIDLKTNQISVIGETPAWNWQQGSKLRYQKTDAGTGICYNSWSQDMGFHSQWHFENDNIHTLPPFYDTSFKHFCYSNFHLHSKIRRGYSYQEAITNDNRFFEFGAHDFLAIGSNSNGEIVSFFEIKDLMKFIDDKNVNHNKVYVEHMTFSPSGSRLGFLLRYRIDDGGIISNFFTYNLASGNISLVVRSGRFSHYCWLDDSSILFYGALNSTASKIRQSKFAQFTPKFFRKTLLKIYHEIIPHNSKISKSLTGDGYHLLRIRDNNFEITSVLDSLKWEDGHPAYCPRNGLIITDTYPDANIKKPACVFGTFWENENLSEPKLLTKLNSIPQFDNSPLRADLHPRISPCGNYLSLDSMCKGFRSVEFYEIRY